MKNILLFLLIFISSIGYAQNPNTLNCDLYVNDFGDLYTEDEEAQLINTIKKVTKITIVIITVNSLDGYSPNEYATTIGNKWHIGSGLNNGLIILICKPERQFYAKPGSGINISDVNFYETYAKPKFKQGKFFEGTRDVLEQYINYLAPAEVAQQIQEQEQVVQQPDNQTQEQDQMQEQVVQDTPRNYGSVIFVLSLVIVVASFVGIIFYKKQEEKRKLEEERQRRENIKNEFISTKNEIKNSITKLSNSIFKNSAKSILISLNELSNTIMSVDPDHWEMEKFIEKYSELKSRIKLKLDEINAKISLLDSCKKLQNTIIEFIDSRKRILSDYSELVNNLVFIDSKNITQLKDIKSCVDTLIGLSTNLDIAYNAIIGNPDSDVDFSRLKKVVSDIDYQKLIFRRLTDELDNYVKDDNEKIRIAKQGKNELLNQINRYASFIGKNGVSYNGNQTTRINCESLTSEINRRFNTNLINNYNVYNELRNKLQICNIAEREYKEEQERLRLIREEEERIEKERLRRIREEEERIERLRLAAILAEQQERDRERERQRDYEREQERQRQQDYDNSSSSSSSFSSSNDGDGGSW